MFLLSSYFFVRGIREGELTILYPMLVFRVYLDAALVAAVFR